MDGCGAEDLLFLDGEDPEAWIDDLYSEKSPLEIATARVLELQDFEFDSFRGVLSYGD